MNSVISFCVRIMPRSIKLFSRAELSMKTFRCLEIQQISILESFHVYPLSNCSISLCSPVLSCACRQDDTCCSKSERRMTIQISGVLLSTELNSVLCCLNTAFPNPHSCTKSYLGLLFLPLYFGHLICIYL